MSANKYDKEKSTKEILDKIAEGESLRSVCQAEGMPSKSLFLLWCSEDKDLADQYARAMHLRIDALAEKALEIAADTTNDTYSTDNGEVPNSVAVQRSRLQIDTIKWFAGKLHSTKYGDKVQQEITGAGGKELKITFLE